MPFLQYNYPNDSNKNNFFELMEENPQQLRTSEGVS